MDCKAKKVWGGLCASGFLVFHGCSADPAPGAGSEIGGNPPAPQLSAVGATVPPWTPPVVTQSTTLAAPSASADVTEPAETETVVPTTPLIGGTLLVTASGLLVAAEPAAARISVVDLTQQKLVRSIALPSGSRPTQLAEDSAGRVYVVLRGLGQVTSFVPDDASSAQITLPVCVEPRGITYASAVDRVVVACRSGNAVWLEPGAAELERTQFIAPDLRDVVADEDGLWFTTFRQANVVRSTFEGELSVPLIPPTITAETASGVYEPHVATRALRLSGTSVVVSHQRAEQEALGPAYYAVAGCSGGVVHNSLSVMSTTNTTVETAGVLPSGLMLDMALSSDGNNVAILSRPTANDMPMTESRVDVFTLGKVFEGEPCDPLDGGNQTPISATATAIAMTPAGEVVVQLRDPAAVMVLGQTPIALETTDYGAGEPPDSVTAGERLFYTTTARGIACAHCHPEGEEDGVTWHFAADGLRRTQSLAGRISATAPLHWRGERQDMGELLQDTLVSRMGGTDPGWTTTSSLTAFLDGLALPKPMGTAANVQAGLDVFQRLGCDKCHTGPNFTDNLNHDVGTGSDYQTPSLLGVSYRVPLMHDGCAKTLLDRFGSCGGDERHGDMSTLTAAEQAQLVQYLESL
ncbi:MAG TPA: hypothetical protein VHM70_00885 [Polyangiaceae bacterium]|nr:hypothetical protein [Polyangiaceae bacterium]